MSSSPEAPTPDEASLRHRLWEIIFEVETPVGKAFDIILLWAIGLSVLAVMLETIEPIRAQWGAELILAEWAFTVLFTVEYLLRLWLSRRPLNYALSFFGIIDLIACLPQYVALIVGTGYGFGVVRVLRLLRMFRVLKMVSHLRGARIILRALSAARPKITVFFTFVLLLCTIAGTLIYFVESGEPNTRFTSIPTSIYYSVVSVTTVGYGDITVTTDIGRFITTLMILAGYAIIAVPTGIVAADISRAEAAEGEEAAACPACGVYGHVHNAKFCYSCGDSLSWTEAGEGSESSMISAEKP